MAKINKKQKNCVSTLHFVSLSLFSENGKHDRLKICSCGLSVQVQ